MVGRDVPDTSTINSNSTLNTNPQFKEVQDLFSVLCKEFRTGITTGSSESSVIPNENINLLVQKVLEIVSMGVVDHVLVSHGVRVA
jgi:hypothetical protein